ncbi:Hsp70 family protein [Dactylosporangium sp. CA-092794]|uniref:Hsp70 family protein n=1 Tax=Dactylosporangium sp. CA-092794 TaxID=3239929 RepID=UPI003D9474C7
MAAEGFRLGCDFGTSHTVAVLAWPDGRTRPLLFDGSPLLPSTVCWDPALGLLAGVDAAVVARARPESVEPSPKRCIDDGTVLLGAQEVAVEEMVGAVLRRAFDEAARVAGGAVPSIVLTHPAGWGPARRETLRAAAALAGAPRVGLVTEPTAAAAYFLGTAAADVPVNSCAVVYDLGAGTFDASVVRRRRDRFEVLATVGLTDVGGLDIDALIVEYLGGVYGTRDPQRWRELAEPDSTAGWRARRQLWADVRAGKESLSRIGATLVPIPGYDDEAPLGRDQVEALARPLLDRTVAATREALREARIDRSAVSAVFLVGGSSRIPLVATLLHRALGIAPTVLEQPELVVAEGALHADADWQTYAPPAPPAPPPVEEVAEPEPEPEPVAVAEAEAEAEAEVPDGPPPRRRVRRPAVAGAVLALLLVAGLVFVFAPRGTGGGPSRPGAGASASQSPSPSPSVGPSGVQPVALLRAQGQKALSLAYNGDGSLLAAGGEDGVIRLWNPKDRTAAGELDTGTGKGIYKVVFSRDGSVLAGYVGSESQIRLWSVATRQPLGTLAVADDQYGINGVSDVAMGAGSMLAAVGGDDSVQLWDFNTRKKNGAVLNRYPVYASELAFNAAGTLLATCADGAPDDPVYLWDVASRRRVGQLKQPLDHYCDLTASPANDVLAVTSDGTYLWDFAGDKLLGGRRLDTDGAVAFSADGGRLVSGGKGIKIFDVASGQQLVPPKNSGDTVYVHAVFSPDGATVATGGAGGVQLWDVAALLNPVA